MTSIEKTKHRCNSCGNKNVEIKRRYKDDTYCANCYRIWFVKKPCSQCGEINRLHKKEDFAVCRSCRMSQPCIRCGGVAVKNGANTEYGRVCQICYQGYFKAEKECFECGKFKRGVSRYTKLSHDQAVCVTCYQGHFRATCPRCHKYRELVDTKEGMACQKCYDLGEIPCESCDKLMPAGMGKRCDDCYWSQRLELETRINSYLLSSDLMRQAYTAFTIWFKAELGSKTATLKHIPFINFFVRCDELWGKIPCYESLVHEFKPNGLREYLTVLRWLIKTKQVVVDPKIKNQIAEEERIVNLLAKLDGKMPRCIIEYHQYLEQKLLMGKTSLKSVRLALQPTIDLCTKYDIEGSHKPSQEQLDGYLLVKHGQYSALYGFIAFLNKSYGLNLACNKPNKDDIQQLKKKEIEQKMIILYEQPKPLSYKDRLVWLQLAMAYFHSINVPVKVLRALKFEVVGNEAVELAFNQKKYYLPLI